jgi:hypothetical protein
VHSPISHPRSALLDLITARHFPVWPRKIFRALICRGGASQTILEDTSKWAELDLARARISGGLKALGLADGPNIVKLDEKVLCYRS